jgi:bifunctional DNase/RNase
LYIGEPESMALMQSIRKTPPPRPLTHDFMKNTLKTFGFKVTKVMVTALVGNTYHAKMCVQRVVGTAVESAEIDCRPSDAINMAMRFEAPIYVCKQVAAQMAAPVDKLLLAQETRSDIERSCRDELLHHPDPTVMLKLQMQVAVAEERYEDAERLKKDLEDLLTHNRVVSLSVALETALTDGRLEEAALLRDQLRTLTNQQHSAQPLDL